ncbi:MAG: hypothetical protein JWM10_142 [Myxococcaceae bacterium]|nr:hypothetical protein [Myxococcaceae bacterium]
MTEGPWVEDVAHFLRMSPYLTLARPAGALRYLKRQLELAEGCDAALWEYPALQIEPLEFFYTCARSLGVLDRGFFEALLFELTWRGVVWGAWLAMIEPRPEFRAPLLSVQSRVPAYNRWIVDCAVCAIEDRSPEPNQHDFTALVKRVRQLLAPIPRPVGRIRRMPTTEEYAAMAQEQARIRRCYAAEGADAALAMIPGTLIGFYTQDYRRWLRTSQQIHG